MEIDIRSCNNIDSARISICQGKLNIKFAPNGTGKSTISRAIQLKDSPSLSELLPFKYRASNPDNIEPLVRGGDGLTKVMCFDEDYVNQFTFRPEELVSNSFDIFIRTDAYKKTEQEIASLVSAIQNVFTNNPELETLIANLKELGGAFKLTRSGLSKASTGMKGLSAGNKIAHIPPGLEPFSPFIKSAKSVGWIDWQTKGQKDFSDLSDACPFCSSDSSDKKEQITQVGKEYDKNIIKNLIGIITVVDKLGEYFSDETRARLATITSLQEGLGKEHEACIVTVKTQIDNLVERLEQLKTLSGFHFKEGEKVAEKLPSYKLDLKFYAEMDSAKTRHAVEAINASIDELVGRAGELQGQINIQRREMQKLIEKHQADINEFLAYAGYKYKVQITGDGGGAHLKLLHVDHDQFLTGGNQHLSFGERNAFAIVLFMYECLSNAPELIILDDPISSFDKNKKFAILEMLFRRDSASCLKGKTVLMLTHDVEPIIDTLKSVKRQFNDQVAAFYIRVTGGQLVEREINETEIKTFVEICKDVVSSGCDNMIKLVYLRRYYEIVDEKGNAYQVLSNLFHKRAKPVDTRLARDGDGQWSGMDANDFSSGCREVAEFITEFDFTETLDVVSDRRKLNELYLMCQNGYEKLQVFRLLRREGVGSIL